jgi:hypothetical protein
MGIYCMQILHWGLGVPSAEDTGQKGPVTNPGSWSMTTLSLTGNLHCGLPHSWDTHGTKVRSLPLGTDTRMRQAHIHTSHFTESHFCDSQLHLKWDLQKDRYPNRWKRTAMEPAAPPQCTPEGLLWWRACSVQEDRASELGTAWNSSKQFFWCLLGKKAFLIKIEWLTACILPNILNACDRFPVSFQGSKN